MDTLSYSKELIMCIKTMGSYVQSMHTDHLVFVSDTETRKKLLKDMFNQCKQILIVCPYVSGKFITQLIQDTKAHVTLVTLDMYLDKGLKLLFKNTDHTLVKLPLSSNLHIKYIIFDQRYVLTGSTNYVPQTFGDKDTSSTLLQEIMNHTGDKYEDIDMFVDSCKLVKLLLDFTKHKFNVDLPICYHCPTVHWKRYGKLHKDVKFKVYLSDPLESKENCITNRFIELCKHTEWCDLYCKSINPPKVIIEALKNVPTWIYTSLDAGFDSMNWMVKNICAYSLSDINNVKVYNYNDHGVMFHHKTYIFHLPKGKTKMLLGSYNLSYRSHYMDIEIMYEFDTTFGYCPTHCFKPIDSLSTNRIKACISDYLTRYAL